MRLFGKHELAGAGQRLETGLSQRRKLILAIAICKHREAKEIEPIITRLVESFEDARFVGISTSSFEQSIGFIATIATKVTLQQINHGPKMTALFDVYLE